MLRASGGRAVFVPSSSRYSCDLPKGASIFITNAASYQMNTEYRSTYGTFSIAVPNLDPRIHVVRSAEGSAPEPSHASS